MFPELPLESRQRQRQRRRDPEACVRCCWPCHHDVEPGRAGLTFRYTAFNQITDDISDARVYGGIHFRFDEDAGADLGRDVATYVYKHNLRRAKHSQDDGDHDDEDDRRPRRRD